MIFEAIKAFVSDLGEFFAKDSHPLALYERLVTKTSSEHIEAIEKHIVAFRKFCTDNDTNISTRTFGFSEPIMYSQRVYIDMNDIFRLATDPDTIDAIWKHLLTLAALLNPTGESYTVLKSLEPVSEGSTMGILKPDCDGDEGDFITDIINKVEKHVSQNEGSSSNPQMAMASIMSSGLITDLVGSLNSGISSGKLDLKKMMGSVQKMVGNLSAEMGENGGAGPNMMLGNMMSMMNMMGDGAETMDMEAISAIMMPK